MKVIILEPNKQAMVEEIGSSLKDMQNVVGGFIELYCPFCDDEVGIIVNEEGKIMNLPSNRMVTKSNKLLDILAGTAFIVGLGLDGDFISLTDEQIQRLMKRINLTTIFC